MHVPRYDVRGYPVPFPSCVCQPHDQPFTPLLPLHASPRLSPTSYIQHASCYTLHNGTTSSTTAMSDDSNQQRSLICLITEGKSSSLFIVEPEGSMSILRLKELIKEKGVKERDVLSRDLTLWKVDLELPHEDERATITGRNVAGSVMLDRELDTVSVIWPTNIPFDPRRAHIVIELPPVHIGHASHATSTSLSSSVTLASDISRLWLAITIKAVSEGYFGGLDALENNHIFKLCGDEPSFLKDFRRKLKQPRWIESDLSILQHLNFLKTQLPGFGMYFQDAPMDARQQDDQDRISSALELFHFSAAFVTKSWKAKNIKEENAQWDLDQLGWHFHSVLGPREHHAFRADWPFGLLVTTGSEGFNYTPRSDFHVAIDNLIHFMVEVQSDKLQADRKRMLLQAACAVRLGTLFYDSPFIVVALYVDKHGLVTRYFLFQHDDKVLYVSDLQQWTEPSRLFAALFEIYNLVSIIRSSRPGAGNIQERVAFLYDELLNNFKNSFTSKKRTHGNTDETRSKRSRTSHRGQGDNGSVLRRGEQAYHDRQVINAFTGAGYTLKSDDKDENGWAPLNKLKSTMRHATQSSGAAVVVKLLRPGSNELEILQYLLSIRSSHNRTIPLVETVKSNLWTFILLPEATPLDLGFAIGVFHGKAVDFSRQLIEGVTFLHQNDVAHLDIKPQNIVALRSQLYIIDFDISVRVDGPSTLIDRWCGTLEWMAPEIGHQDGPKRLYSPIRADLWSCGLVLQYLASKGVGKEENPFESLTEQLLSRDPELRPLLYLAHPLNDLHSGLKRKLDAPSHEAKRLAIGTVHF